MSWDARHFHIELSDARLEGGGQLVGRVHRHGDWPSGEIAVRARCLECWRATTLAARGLPHWEFETLWERHHAILIDRDSTWAPFEFDVPQWLPPAVEATTFAWRYELITQRSVRYWFDETAAITPLLHEGAALRRGGSSYGITSRAQPSPQRPARPGSRRCLSSAGMGPSPNADRKARQPGCETGGVAA